MSRFIDDMRDPMRHEIDAIIAIRVGMEIPKITIRNYFGSGMGKCLRGRSLPDNGGLSP